MVSLAATGVRQSSLSVGKSFSSSVCRFPQPFDRFLNPSGVICGERGHCHGQSAGEEHR